MEVGSRDVVVQVRQRLIAVEIESEELDYYLGPAPITGIYTAQFAGLPYQSVLGTLAAGGSVTTSYSASFAIVSEPAATSWLGAALGLLALRDRRR